jgi:hypothetical protein
MHVCHARLAHCEDEGQNTHRSAKRESAGAARGHGRGARARAPRAAAAARSAAAARRGAAAPARHLAAWRWRWRQSGGGRVQSSESLCGLRRAAGALVLVEDDARAVAGLASHDAAPRAGGQLSKPAI